MDGKLDVLVPCRTSVPSHSQVGVEGCPTSTVLWVGQGGKESRSPQPPTSKPRPKSKGVSLQRKSVKEEVQSEVQVEEVEGACRSLRDSGPPLVQAGPYGPFGLVDCPKLWTGRTVGPGPPLDGCGRGLFTDPNWTSRTVLNLYLRLRVGLGRGFVPRGPFLVSRTRTGRPGPIERTFDCWRAGPCPCPLGPVGGFAPLWSPSPKVQRIRCQSTSPQVRESESCPRRSTSPEVRKLSSLDGRSGSDS